MKQTKKIMEEINIPEETKVEIDRCIITITGRGGTLQRDFIHPLADIKLKDNKIILESNNGDSKREKMIIKTFKSHINNLLFGVNKPFTYKLKICSGHFPMNVTVQNNQLIIKNFLGEKKQRKAKILEGVKVNINGDIVEVESPDIEKAGQVSANMELATRITNRDRRRFMDGIWIIEKGNKSKKND